MSWFHQIQNSIQTPLHFAGHSEDVVLRKLDRTTENIRAIVVLPDQFSEIDQGDETLVRGQVVVESEHESKLNTFGAFTLRGKVFEIEALSPAVGGFVTVTVTRTERQSTHSSTALDPL